MRRLGTIDSSWTTLCRRLSFKGDRCRHPKPLLSSLYSLKFSSLGIPPLTNEQRAIVDACPPPNNNRNKEFKKPGALIRITAGAGAGKTATLLASAVKAFELGHDSITYVTFTTAAAADGKKRLEEALLLYVQGKIATRPMPRIDAFTLHSCAFRRLGTHLGTTVGDMLSDTQIQAWIKTTCEKEITAFVEECSFDKSDGTNPKHGPHWKACDQVAFFIYKSLVCFCRSSWTEQEYADGTDIDRDYERIKDFHAPRGTGEKLGFPSEIYSESDKISFYAQQAAKLWSVVGTQNIRCYDFDMKQVQLSKLRVPGSLLLVDEAQDLDSCQIDWIARQQAELYGTPTVVVGDTAQAIYAFRGAKPQFLMQLKVTREYMLTESWRFGHRIAKLANQMLYCMQQSTGKQALFPYRIRTGLPEKESIVTTKPLIDCWREFPVAVIASSNARLLVEVLCELGFPSTPGVHSQIQKVLPKVHIYGLGQGSGHKLWKRTLDQIQSVYSLYHISNQASFLARPIALNKVLFPQFAGRKVTWDSFTEECAQKELSQYSNAIRVVFLYRDETMEAVKAFREHVFEKTVAPDQADIVLVTGHSAKGMEWDNVQVCDDFASLCSFAKTGEDSQDEASSAMNAQTSNAKTFGFACEGDKLNLLYVACTRAKIRLSIPPGIHEVLRVFDDLHCWKVQTQSEHNQKSGSDGSSMDSDEWALDEERGVLYRRESRPTTIRAVRPFGDVGFSKEVFFEIPGCKNLLNEKEAHSLYDDLVAPLRSECGLNDPKQRLWDALIDNNAIPDRPANDKTQPPNVERRMRQQSMQSLYQYMRECEMIDIGPNK